ncbi:MAG: hypothetical protein R2867_21620 [Caldilineaceae bacterium]
MATQPEENQISLANGDYPDLYMLIPWVDQFSPDRPVALWPTGGHPAAQRPDRPISPNVKEPRSTTIPYYKAMTVAPDGNIYGLPQLIECYHCSFPNKMWVNTKWLDALGNGDADHDGEYKAMLEAFQSDDPQWR